MADQRFLKPLRLALAGVTMRRGKKQREAAHALTRRRRTARLAGLVWPFVLAGLVVAGIVLSRRDVNAAVLYSTLLGLVTGLFVYANPDLPGLHYVSRLIFSVLTPLVAWPLLPLLAGVQLLGGWLHLRTGHVPERRAPETERAPEAPAAPVPQ